ncbi:hypothetical protein GCM10010329_38250 [Streptomyces spiroverticillatus]|uniref:Uncharacterized protein n=1 Tax=Streptomyces finlayi TaxID=67296 RepID=A0A919CAA6_9ACTN|nr:hypothetical protein [Streptomyces finlayi]GHA11700.1 hypothetical protein GCM10010329_38250 [Streptomyces spiroverticillatus]GHC94890.1 hypothetical protein GCM10010334_33360 [Streptomyces finlayi]
MSVRAGLRSLELDGSGEAADLAAFLGRLLRYDRAAAVRLQAHGGALAVFGRPPSFDVLAVRTARLTGTADLDVTVSAGELLDGIEESTGALRIPQAVTGPPWAGLLPPRGGWHQVEGVPDAEAMRGVVAAAVAEFRARDEQLGEAGRTREARDRIGGDIWSRTLAGTELPLRAVHAAQSLGFLRPGVPVALLTAGTWLRLRTPYGSVTLRRATTGGLGALRVGPA